MENVHLGSKPYIKSVYIQTPYSDKWYCIPLFVHFRLIYMAAVLRWPFFMILSTLRFWIFEGNLLLFRKMNFRQNTTVWMQSMHTHNLTQAQELVSYTQSIQLWISLARKLHAPGKRGALAWIAVLLCKALFFCLKFYFFFNNTRGWSLSTALCYWGWINFTKGMFTGAQLCGLKLTLLQVLKQYNLVALENTEK